MEVFKYFHASCIPISGVHKVVGYSKFFLIPKAKSNVLLFIKFTSAPVSAFSGMKVEFSILWLRMTGNLIRCFSLEACGMSIECEEAFLEFRQTFPKWPFVLYSLQIACAALQSCPLWFLPFPHLQQVFFGSKSFLGVPSCLVGFTRFPFIPLNCCDRSLHWNFQTSFSYYCLLNIINLGYLLYTFQMLSLVENLFS